MSVMDWTGGLIQRPDVPISVMRLPARVHRMDDDELPEFKGFNPTGRRPSSLMARVKALIGRHGQISTRELKYLLPNEPEKAVAVAARNLVRLREIRQVGKEPRAGSRGSGCGIWELTHPMGGGE